MQSQRGLTGQGAFFGGRGWSGPNHLNRSRAERERRSIPQLFNQPNDGSFVGLNGFLHLALGAQPRPSHWKAAETTDQGRAWRKLPLVAAFQPRQGVLHLFAQAFEPNPNREAGPQSRAYQAAEPTVLYLPSIFGGLDLVLLFQKPSRACLTFCLPIFLF